MVLAALIGFPIYWMLITAFKRNFRHHHADRHSSGRSIRAGAGSARCCTTRSSAATCATSAIITVAAVGISIVIGFFGAMAIARFPLRRTQGVRLRRADCADDSLAGVDDSHVVAARQRASQELADRHRGSPT